MIAQISGGTTVPDTIPYQKTNYAGIVGTAAVEIVAPATNTKGILVHNAIIVPANGTSLGLVGFGTAAPVNYTDVTDFSCISCLQNGSQTPVSKPMYIPPGQGLYAIASLAGYAFHVCYEVLQ